MRSSATTARRRQRLKEKQPSCGWCSETSTFRNYQPKEGTIAKQKSRTARWQEAAGNARTKFDEVQAASDGLAEALQELRDVQSEYEDWRDNLPENLQQSALGEKLNAVIDEIDLESIMESPLENWTEVESAIDAAEGADLPLGFGRD